MSTKPFKVVVTISVQDQDEQIVDHRGYSPRKQDKGLTTDLIFSGHGDVSEANKMLNAVYATLDIMSDIRDIIS